MMQWNIRENDPVEPQWLRLHVAEKSRTRGPDLMVDLEVKNCGKSGIPYPRPHRTVHDSGGSTVEPPPSSSCLSTSIFP
jgi:hypothetical protein